ncbi:Rhodanese-like protein [Aphelenchoides besseyi]|nr:Rhodanese-like protein [Aphelenchoides besseyi]
MNILIGLFCLLSLSDFTIAESASNATKAYFVVKSPTYRTANPQAVDPTRPADPSLANYLRETANYRVQEPPSATAPPPQVVAQEPISNEYRQPNGIMLPPGSARPNNEFYDQLAKGKAAGFTPMYQPRPFYDTSGQIVPAYPQNTVNPEFIGPVVPQQPQTIYGIPEPIPIVVDVEFLDRALMNRRPIRLLDATPSQQTYKMDYRQFRDEYYGKWDRLFQERANAEFQRVHSFDILTVKEYRNDPQALYPQDLFEQYVRRLGINQGDHIIVYSRGTLGGMLSAARVWNLFRIYGHNRVSILDGGFEAWRNANLTLTDVGAPIEPGNWTACFDASLVIAYEDLIMPDSNGFCVLNRLCYYNFLDARPKPDFYGLQERLRDQQLDYANRGNGQFNNGFNGPIQNNNNQPPFTSSPAPPLITRRSALPGAKSLPAEDLVRPDGFLLNPSELKLKLQQAGYTPGRESVALGETPDEASMVVLALAMIQDPKVRLYNAGIPEIRLRSPNLINS